MTLKLLRHCEQAIVGVVREAIRRMDSKTTRLLILLFVYIVLMSSPRSVVFVVPARNDIFFIN